MPSSKEVVYLHKPVEGVPIERLPDMVLVPSEPSREMCAAAEREWGGEISAHVAELWRAMIAAHEGTVSPALRQIKRTQLEFAIDAARLALSRIAAGEPEAKSLAEKTLADIEELTGRGSQKLF